MVVAVHAQPPRNGRTQLASRRTALSTCLLAAGNKEKVMRIALMTLTQLVASTDESQQSAMVEAGLPRIVRIRSAQAWSDEDIPALLESLDESLNTSVAALSSFEKYRNEVLTGVLDWSPMHTSKAFWQVCPGLPACCARHRCCACDSYAGLAAAHQPNLGQQSGLWCIVVVGWMARVRSMLWAVWRPGAVSSCMAWSCLVP